jgi:PEP-CTERM motif
MKLRSFAILILSMMASVSHAAIIGSSTGPTNGGLRMDGLGAGAFEINDPAGGQGVVGYTLGACLVSSPVFTSCTFSGNYVDGAGGDGTPGGGGAFSLVISYNQSSIPVLGGRMPILAEIGSAVPSTDPNDPYNQATFVASDESVLSTLTLNPSGGGTIIRRSGFLDPTNPTSRVSEFGWFTQFFNIGENEQPICTGLAPAAACGVGNVSLVEGAVISGAVAAFGFTATSVETVPLPGTLALFSLGAIALFARRKTTRHFN